MSYGLFFRFIYKRILGRRMRHNDIAGVDGDFYKHHVVWMRDNDIMGVIDDTFTYQRHRDETPNLDPDPNAAIHTWEQARRKGCGAVHRWKEEVSQIILRDRSSFLLSQLISIMRGCSIENVDIAVNSVLDAMPLRNNRKLDNENKHEYLDLLVEYRLSHESEPQLRAMLQGLIAIHKT